MIHGNNKTALRRDLKEAKDNVKKTDRIWESPINDKMKIRGI